MQQLIQQKTKLSQELYKMMKGKLNISFSFIILFISVLAGNEY